MELIFVDPEEQRFWLCRTVYVLHHTPHEILLKDYPGHQSKSLQHHLFSADSTAHINAHLQ